MAKKIDKSQQINYNKKERFNEIVETIQVERPGLPDATLLEHDDIVSLYFTLATGLTRL